MPLPLLMKLLRGAMSASVADQKERGHVQTHNCLAGLLVVSPLFQQSGFAWPLDRDQVRLHNTLLCF